MYCGCVFGPMIVLVADAGAVDVAAVGVVGDG